jgi:hypothetical protein
MGIAREDFLQIKYNIPEKSANIMSKLWAGHAESSPITRTATP